MMHTSPAVQRLLHHELSEWERRLVLLRVVLVTLILLLAGWAALALNEGRQLAPVYVIPGAKAAGKAVPVAAR